MMEHDPKELRKLSEEYLQEGRRHLAECLDSYADLIERSRLQAAYIKDMETTLATLAKSLGMDKPDADKLIERHAKLLKHAEAMAGYLGYLVSATSERLVKEYRADFPKE